MVAAQVCTPSKCCAAGMLELAHATVLSKWRCRQPSCINLQVAIGCIWACRPQLRALRLLGSSQGLACVLDQAKDWPASCNAQCCPCTCCICRHVLQAAASLWPWDASACYQCDLYNSR